MRFTSALRLVILLLLVFVIDEIAVAQALPNTSRLLRFPTTNGQQIVFCYAGDLYTVAKDGGIARRLTSGPGYRFVPAFLAGWQTGRLHRAIRRQHRSLRDARRRRRAQAAHVHGHPRPRRCFRPHGAEQHRHGMAEHEAARRFPLADADLQLLHRRALHGRPRRRSAPATAAAARRVPLVFAGRLEAGLQPRLPRVPHLETLSRRHGRRCLDFRFQDRQDRRT